MVTNLMLCDVVEGVSTVTHIIIVEDDLGGTVSMGSSHAHLRVVECVNDAIHTDHGGGQARSNPG
jgi:hypothetical protein